MWRVILGVFTTLLSVILNMMGKNKTSEEQLPDPSDSEKAKDDADAKAEEKFGPRGGQWKR